MFKRSERFSNYLKSLKKFIEDNEEIDETYYESVNQMTELDLIVLFIFSLSEKT